MNSQDPPIPRSRSLRKWWCLGAAIVVPIGLCFAWDRGVFDPDDYALVRAALDETQGDEAQVRAIAGIYREQAELKRTSWRRRHGPWRYSLGAYVNAMEAIMERDPRSEAAREAATWIIGRDTGAAAGKAIRVLSEHHLQATPSAPLSRQPFDEAQDALERQIDQHTDPQLRALAQLALVEWHLFIEEAARDASKILALEPSEQEEAAFFVGGLRAVEYAQSRDAASEHQAAIELLIQLRGGATEHLPPSEADQAAQLITELLELGLGSVAPEIVGTDLQGDEMRLSDYRGKVVVLDFWGHW